jgi:hypothetical protein
LTFFTRSSPKNQDTKTSSFPFIHHWNHAISPSTTLHILRPTSCPAVHYPPQISIAIFKGKRK